MLKFLKHIALVAIMALGVTQLTGCQALKGWWEDGGQERVRLAVKEGIESLIQDNPEYQDEIIKIAQDARAHYNADPTQNAGEIVERISEKLPWEDWSTDTTLIARAVLEISQRHIAQKIEESEVKEDAKVEVGKYFTWIEETALNAKAKRSLE